MGIHYKVFIRDDHDFDYVGTSATHTADRINRELSAVGVEPWTSFQYVPEAESIIGELRKVHPSSVATILLSAGDHVYYDDDSSGSHLKELHKSMQMTGNP